MINRQTIFATARREHFAITKGRLSDLISHLKEDIARLKESKAQAFWRRRL
ncbi:hypothetical protein IQ238_20300 [Pleurocapsales cyanobacterium LEGE 06147]|nr:hypothetical protein [Pleurocapsales cyanobacterium LEGE 06147]